MKGIIALVIILLVIVIIAFAISEVHPFQLMNATFSNNTSLQYNIAGPTGH